MTATATANFESSLVSFLAANSRANSSAIAIP
jgi:hypothetical protein